MVSDNKNLAWKHKKIETSVLPAVMSKVSRRIVVQKTLYLQTKKTSYIGRQTRPTDVIITSTSDV